MHGFYNHDWMYGGSGMLFGGVFMILLWIVPLFMLFALLKYLFARPSGDGSRKYLPERKMPLDILKEAYARGEINREQFLQKRDDLLEK